MTNGPRERLAEAGLTIPDVVAPVAAYVPATRSGSYVYTAGQLPFREGRLLHVGKAGAAVDLERAQACARQCALNVVAAVESVVGDLSSIRQIVKLTVFVASASDFTQQPAVANAASELMALAFGERGVHARSAVGVAVLPLDAPVEVEAIVEVA